MTEQRFLQKLDNGYVAIIIDSKLEISWVVISRGYCYEYNMLAFGVYPFVVWEEWEPYRVDDTYIELVTSEVAIDFVYPTEQDKHMFNNRALAEVLFAAQESIIELNAKVQSLQLTLYAVNARLDEVITDLEEHRSGNY